MRIVRLIALAAPLLALACASSTPQDQDPATAAFDPAQCKGLWQVQVANGSQHSATVAWAATSGGARQRLGIVHSRENLLFHFRSPTDGIPEIWINHEGSNIDRHNTEALEDHKLGIVLSCDEGGQQ
ncbi:MAG: hypothetical protein V3T74_08865 [Gemmatimonadales bacterium]